ncbi:hypothetical protein ANCCEY_05302 [Ancylostoma ceylanicum]|uniref:Uncharacterized protein n=1 Tax=Ancylostoma ceylanicum TaxID=53326 RepID=A0A0D6LWN8_9BILA|nr:hypothetical protein ANCCEY_05302 [Ancylostoma ceylanicum]
MCLRIFTSRQIVNQRSPCSAGYMKVFDNLLTGNMAENEMAKFEEGTESEIAHYYNDVETMRLVNAMANIIGE